VKTSGLDSRGGQENFFIVVVVVAVVVESLLSMVVGFVSLAFDMIAKWDLGAIDCSRFHSLSIERFLDCGWAERRELRRRSK